MYANYGKWAARAYLRRAEALQRGYNDVKAAETLREMMKNEELTKFPEYEQGRQLLAKLESK